MVILTSLERLHYGITDLRMSDTQLHVRTNETKQVILVRDDCVIIADQRCDQTFNSALNVAHSSAKQHAA